MIQGVLFDFDGTLTRPGALDFPAIKRELGCPVETPILEYLDTLPSARRAKLMKILEEKEDDAAEFSQPNNGVEKCLSFLRNRHILFGILTRNSLRSVKKALLRFNATSIEDFAAIITRDVSLPKPNPDGVIEAARRMGIHPSRLLVVGDFRFDVMAGKAAGACTVLLTNGGKSSMAHGDPEPDYTSTNFEELIDIISGILG